MLLIQFILIINLLLLLIDYPTYSTYASPKGPWTKAQTARDSGPKGCGPRIARPSRPRDYWGSYSLGSAVGSAWGSGVESRQPNCFAAPKATLNCQKKCHHVWSSSLSGTIYCYSTVPLALSYSRDDQRIISTCGDWQREHLHSSFNSPTLTQKLNKFSNKFTTKRPKLTFKILHTTQSTSNFPLQSIFTATDSDELAILH